MKKSNKVFIATSLDGYIADRDGGIDWLQQIPNPDQHDMGYKNFMKKVDAIVMGRNTFELVCSFDMDWPYPVPVFVMSRTLSSIPVGFSDKAELVKGRLSEILESIHQKGYNRLYMDGGQTIQSFLQEDLIDEITITTIPILLGGGVSLFSDLPEKLEFELVHSEVWLNEVVQSHYRRKK